MSDKWIGRLLILDKEDCLGRKFPKNAKINYPEKVPVTIGFAYGNPLACIGHATVEEQEDYVTCYMELTRDDFKDFIDDGMLYIGGYYNHVKLHVEDDVTVVDEANLCGIGILPKNQSCDFEMIAVREENAND